MRSKPTKISKSALKDFYELRGIVQKIVHNWQYDVNNHRKADKMEGWLKESNDICDKWINSQPPIK